MARPIKNTVDYFPHIIKHGKTMFVLESKYGNDGYAFWFKLLELLGSSNGQVYDYNNPADWEFMLAKTKVDEETANNILKTLASVNAIDKELLEKKLIWSDNFIKNIEDVYKRRKQEIPQKPISTNNKSINVNNNPININKNTQTKLKETKLNKTKEKYSPTSGEVRLSTLLLKLILDRKANFKKPDIQKWYVPIDRLLHIDKRTPQQIEKVIRWCQQDNFWQDNILSTKKLREQIDKLELKMDKEPQQSKQQGEMGEL